MDHFESEDTDITSQKENDPLKAREENTMTQSHQELVNSDTKLTVMQQVGRGRCSSLNCKFSRIIFKNEEVSRSDCSIQCS